MLLIKNWWSSCWVKRWIHQTLKHNLVTIILQENLIQFNLSQCIHCYKYTYCLYCEHFYSSFSPTILFRKKVVLILFSFSFFYTSHLTKCQPLIPVAVLVYPLNLNLFLKAFVLFLTTMESHYSRKIYSKHRNPHMC